MRAVVRGVDRRNLRLVLECDLLPLFLLLNPSPLRHSSRRVANLTLLAIIVIVSIGAELAFPHLLDGPVVDTTEVAEGPVVASVLIFVVILFVLLCARVHG